MHTLHYYKKNAEEDYKSTPISVLRYISELEIRVQKEKERQEIDKMLMDEEYFESEQEVKNNKLKQ